MRCWVSPRGLGLSGGVRGVYRLRFTALAAVEKTSAVHRVRADIIMLIGAFAFRGRWGETIGRGFRRGRLSSQCRLIITVINYNCTDNYHDESWQL